MKESRKNSWIFYTWKYKTVKDWSESEGEEQSKICKEGATEGVLKKKRFLKFYKFTNLCWSLYLTKLQASRPATLLKRDSDSAVFLRNLRNFAILKNIWKRLLLFILSYQELYHPLFFSHIWPKGTLETYTLCATRIVRLTMRHHLFLEFLLVDTWFFTHWRHHRAVTRIENVRQSNIRRGKKLGFQLSHKHPLRAGKYSFKLKTISESY